MEVVSHLQQPSAIKEKKTKSAHSSLYLGRLVDSSIHELKVAGYLGPAIFWNAASIFWYERLYCNNEPLVYTAIADNSSNDDDWSVAYSVQHAVGHVTLLAGRSKGIMTQTCADFETRSRCLVAHSTGTSTKAENDVYARKVNVRVTSSWAQKLFSVKFDCLLQFFSLSSRFS